MKKSCGVDRDSRSYGRPDVADAADGENHQAARNPGLFPFISQLPILLRQKPAMLRLDGVHRQQGCARWAELDRGLDDAMVMG